MMTTKDDFLFFKDKNGLNSDKRNQYSNLNLNQNQNSTSLIPVLFSTKQCNKKIFDSFTVHQKGKGKAQPWNKPGDLFLHTLSLNDKAEEKAKKKWKKDGLSNVNSSTISLHISAYEDSKEITELDTLDGENVELKKNKTNMDKQLLPCLMIQNPFEFPRQQEEEKEPEVTGFRASQRLLGSNQPSASNDARLPTAVAPDIDLPVGFFLKK
uniref:Uncharacterized protein n=1 Tax=Panagrolaimus davidi TaxID=227884 RepID=A0A914PZS0_9BILA